MIRSLLLFTAAATAQVPYDRIVNAAKEPGHWLTYSGNYQGHRYSPLTEITPQTAKNLRVRWAYQFGTTGNQTSPIVVDNVMYVSGPNTAAALDLRTGRELWKWSRNIPADYQSIGFGRTNRGPAVLGDKLYVATLDCYLVALDLKSGIERWSTKVEDYKVGYSMTVAPLALKDKVLIGISGGEAGIRGFVDAYDANTGKQAWRFYTVAGPDTWGGDAWKTGGGSTWVTGSYDPDQNLVYWGVGNPGPDWNGDPRPGDNLYTCSFIALDGDTGKLKWYFQFTPHDNFDYDAVQVPLLVDMNWTGRDGRTQPRKLMLWGNRNGFFYALDRTTGQYLLGKPFVKVTWASGLDEAGRPMRINGVEPTADGNDIYPSQTGGTNWYSPSFSPRTGLFYVSAWEHVHGSFQKAEGDYEEGKRYTGGGVKPTRLGTRGPQVTKVSEDDGYGVVRALDPKTGALKWEFPMPDVTASGILTTATDVLFTGGRQGFFHALDARTGKLLWKIAGGGDIAMGPMTYQVNGKQYVAFAAGSSLFAFALK